jgi:chemotaxis protein methyltransferase CheR
MQLAQTTFERIRRDVYRLCGLVIGDDKRYLVHDRLKPIVLRHGWDSFDALADRLATGPSSALQEEVVEAIVTHETSFFRDPAVWEALQRDILPRSKTSPVHHAPPRVWSAASSTGQEAYSLAMVLAELAEARDRTAPPFGQVLATDICSSALAAGQAGLYSARDVDRGVSDTRRLRFFEPQSGAWRVRSELRSMVTFRRLNLVGPWPPLGAFELICCRNVLIYFDEPTRRAIVDRFHEFLVPGGWLVLGAAENLYGISNLFESVVTQGALVYRKT